MPEQLHKDLQELIPEVKKLTNRIRIWRSVLAALVVIALAMGVLVWRNSVVVSCVHKWAVAVTDRQERIGPLSNERVDKLLQAFFFAAAGPRDVHTQAHKDALTDLARLRKKYPGLPSQAEAEKLPTGNILADIELVSALNANKAYQDAITKHPVPDVAGFNCSLF
jgi:hypothetical protein